jgi:hypothetical protein
MFRMCRFHCLYSLLAALVCLSAGGCSGEKKVELPKTFAVRGKVVNEGGHPMVDGSLQLEPIDGPAGSTAIVGSTGEDGRYEISTIKDNAKVPGAPEGSYRIRVTPRMGADQKDNSVVLPGPYKVEPNDNNTFDLTIPGPAAPPE